MSLSQLQTATAALVRFPEEGRDDAWEMFSAQFNLTLNEQLMLHYVAHNTQVIKYGKKLRYFRFSDTIESLPNLETILGEQLFKELWFDYFEPKASEVPSENLTGAFLSFLRTDAKAMSILSKEAPPYAADFIHFLHVKNSLESIREEWSNRSLPNGSLLAHGAVYPMQLEHDVPQALRSMGDGTFDLDNITKKTVYYVFALKADAELPSLFAVDKEVFQFLTNQLTTPDTNANLPGVYADLVQAGICVPTPRSNARHN